MMATTQKPWCRPRLDQTIYSVYDRIGEVMEMTLFIKYSPNNIFFKGVD